MIRILLADSHPASSWAIKTMIAEESEFELVGEATDTYHLCELSKTYHPHLILIDREIPGEQIEEIIAELHLLDPKPVVIVMSSHAEQARFVLKAGADAFVSKVDDPAWLVEKLRTYAKIGAKEDANRNK
jgi:DNA-binding NarL/FixJ family response regulator